MNTISNSTLNVFISESNSVEYFNIISPSVEGSYSTGTIESKNAQISSKSSTLLNSLILKNSSKLLHLPETTAISCVSELIRKDLLSSAISSETRSPIERPLLPFVNGTYKGNKKQFQQKGKILKYRCENMLSTSGNNNPTPPSTTNGGTTPLQANNASPTNSFKNLKSEPFSTLSPLNDSANSQSIVDETSNSNTGGSNIVTMDSNVKRERDGTTTSTSTMHQNSNSSVKSCPHTVNASSPNNASDHSNSSNISTNLSQTIENGTTDILPDLHISEKSGNKKKTNLNSLATVKEEETGVKPTVDNNGSLSAPSTKNLKCTATSSLNSMSSVKEETGVMVNLINVKKEDGNISPDMSPAGFCSINILSGNSSIDVTSCTPGKIDDTTKAKMIPNCNISNSNNNNEKVGSGISSINNNAPSSCTEDSLTVSASSSVISHSSNESCIGSTHNSAVNLINNINNAGGSIANCMEYMQQQNHIFVFSTQLANKGAESVLSGQVPTIIAYHCTQPATKNFLEDFFIKNPMKISKLHRQNTLNLCNISVGAGGQQWIGSCSTLPKISQKPIGNKMNFTGMPGALESKMSLRQSNIPNFSEVSDSLGGNENDLMRWEQTRNNLEGASNESHPGLKINGVDAGVGGGSHISNKSHGTPDTTDSCTPSLQGIKVPDENLTPQQRQHREEQLAKLKQLDQFLSNPLQGVNQLSKLSTNGVPGNLASLMLNLPNSGSSSMGSQMNNQLNPNIRNPSNVINSNNLNICNPEIPATMCDGNIGSQDMLSGHEINNLACNPNKSMQINNQSNMPCVSNGVVGNVAPNVPVGNITSSSLSCHTGVNNNGDSTGNGNINGPGGLMPNSPEIVGSFIGDGNLNNNGVKVMSSGGTHSQEMGHVGMAQMGWSKLQHQFFEERIKGNKGQGPNDVPCLPAALCHSNSASMGNANMRPNMTGSCASTSTTNSQSIRSAQGPPPPYHPTQRSASVPIATQSPNPASPNNPTSNLSLPSPRTSGPLGIPANSPNMDVHVSAMSTQAVTTTSTVITAISNGIGHGKNNFQPEGSPSSTGTSNSITMANNNNNRNRNNQINQFNSNPSTPLSHLSPKDLESFHTTVTTGDLKNARPSPQRSRTPLMGHNNGSVADASNIEGRFPSVSPGLTFPQHLNNTSNSGVNAYKGPGPIERQNSVPASSQFCRRADNLPLNPNSNRPSQNKLNHSFDPISSLAQMSQQLTSCVSLNTGSVGNTGGVGSMAAIGVNDVNVTNNVNQNIDNMMASMDSGLDHCNAGMAMPPHMSGTGPFISNNCHINSMLGPLGQRLLNPKICGGFNTTTGSMGRDGPAGLHGVIPSHRMMGRMAMNFGNFSVSPNIQVKASTPNTIQYMPVRSQNNNNSNIRVPPSLEFLRYANSQMTGAANMFDNSHMGQVNTATASDLGKLNNCNGPAGSGNSGMSFFGNCNHIGSMVGDQEDMAGGNLTPSHEINLCPHPSMVRGMRPIRQQQHLGNQMLPGPRMQNPGVIPGHFPNGPQDSMECGDNSMFIGNSPNGHGPTQGVAGVAAQTQMYSGGNGQQKSVKSIGSNNLCQNMNTPNATNNGQMAANSNLLPNEHNPSMLSPANGPLMMGNSINMLSNTMPVGNSASPAGCSGNTGNGPGDVGNVAYKPFVGPASSDIKYAQQYHSFQQQLYATSTRSQHNTGNANIGSNASTNPTFFVNK